VLAELVVVIVLEGMAEVIELVELEDFEVVDGGLVVPTAVLAVVGTLLFVVELPGAVLDRDPVSTGPPTQM
jgi:hypothetical protein